MTKRPDERKPQRARSASIRVFSAPSSSQRGEFVEERRDQHRVEHHCEQIKAEPEGPDPDPPALTAGGHQPQHDGDHRQADAGCDSVPINSIS